MSQSDKFKIPFRNATPVVLSGISDNQIIESETLEPQLIRIRSNNLGYMYVDSRDTSKPVTEPPVNIIIGGQGKSLFKDQIKRIKLVFLDLFWITPNCNVRNNEIKFISSNTGATVYTVTVPEGQYDEASIFPIPAPPAPPGLIDALVAAMNTVTGASGLTFSHSLNGATSQLFDGRAGTLDSAGGSYQILESKATLRGEPLWNLIDPSIDVLSVSKPIGFINLRYTRFIEFRSDTLSQFSKNRNVAGTRGTNNLIFRLFPSTEERKITLIRSTIRIPVTFNFNPSFTLRSFDLSLFDEFGNILYVPDYNPGNSGGFWYQLIFISET